MSNTKWISQVGGIFLLACALWGGRIRTEDSISKKQEEDAAPSTSTQKYSLRTELAFTERTRHDRRRQY